MSLEDFHLLDIEPIDNSIIKRVFNFINLNMPIKVFGNSSSSYDNGNKIDTSQFVQKPYLRSNYIGSNIEEDIDIKSQYRIENLPDPINNKEAASINYVDEKFNDPT